MVLFYREPLQRLLEDETFRSELPHFHLDESSLTEGESGTDEAGGRRTVVKNEDRPRVMELLLR